MTILHADSLTNGTVEGINTYNSLWRFALGANPNIEVGPGGAFGNLSAAFSIAFWNGVVWPADQWTQCTIDSLDTVSGIGLANRINATGPSCYFAYVNSTTYWVGYYLSGTQNFLTTASNTFNVGDVLYFGTQGITLTFQQNGNTLYTVNDTTLTQPAAAGLITQGNAGLGIINTWEGGNFFVAPMFYMGQACL